MSRDSEGWARPKILLNFPAMNRFQNLDFLWFPAIFRGPKNSPNADFFAVSWDVEGWARRKMFGTWTPSQFSWNFEGTDPPKKSSHWTANPATVRCEKLSQIASAHGYCTLLRPQRFR